jgi:hypothetical protein
VYNAAAPGAVSGGSFTIKQNVPDNCRPVGSVPGCVG